MGDTGYLRLVSSGPRKTRIPPEQQRAILVMLVTGAALLIALAIIGVLLHYLS